MKTKTKPRTIQEKVAQSIKIANAKYKKATPAQRRVMIAQDVIDRVKRQKYEVKCGTIVDFHDAYELCKVMYPETVRSRGHSVQEAIHAQDCSGKKNDTICEVCAVGGLMISAVSFRNKINFGTCGDIVETHHNDDLEKAIEEFSKSQMQLIEIAFEQGEGIYTTEETYYRSQIKETKSTKAAMRWAKKYNLGYDSKKRLIAIMKNIIKHKGQFNPFVK